MHHQNSTITIPLATAEKLAALGRAMLSLAEEMKQHAAMDDPKTLPFPIPDLTPPKEIPQDQPGFGLRSGWPGNVRRMRH